MLSSNQAVKRVLGALAVIALASGAGWGARQYFSTPSAGVSPTVPTTEGAAQASHVPFTNYPQIFLNVTEPVAAVKTRLAYEKDRPANTSDLPVGMWDRLDRLESMLDEEKRQWMRAEPLVALHARSTSDFVEAQGFGMSRMIQFAPSRAPQFVDFAQAPPQEFTRYDVRPLADKQAPPNSQFARHNGVGRLHLEGVFGYVNSGGLGLVTPALPGAQGGPSSRYRLHGFSNETNVTETAAKKRWLVRQVELVSLLKHEGACAYVSNSLPRMKARGHVETRQLTEFEQKALDALRQGDDLISASSQGRLHLLGSLRAGRQCLDCHEVERGTLLGALSYELAAPRSR